MCTQQTSPFHANRQQFKVILGYRRFYSRANKSVPKNVDQFICNIFEKFLEKIHNFLLEYANQIKLSQSTPVLPVRRNLIGSFYFDWHIVTGSCEFSWGTSQKYCGIIKWILIPQR